jgi:N-acetylmuramoyl-L-alanine amidase CwlA
MSKLSTKIKIYLDREVDFTKDVILQDDMVSGVSSPYIKEWNVAEAQPTEEQLNALESEATTLESNNQVIATRKSLYGTPEEQLEILVEQGVDKLIERNTKIKTDNPKE